MRAFRSALCCGIALSVLGAAGAVQAQTKVASSGGGTTGGETAVSEVVVTASRREQTVNKVPISVAVHTRSQMEQQGVKQLSDLVRLTPGLVVNTSAFGDNDVSIRGVRSQAGASTTGIYIDDVPIQTRNLVAGSTAFPVVFDLDRVEVLRGPQGTLFGAGSEGGTVRFITPQPSLNHYSGEARLEGALTPGGAGSYEAGMAIGGPLIEDKLGFRASAYYRYDGGWIDKVPGSFTVVDPTGGSYGKSLTFTPSGPGEKNVNDVKSTALRLALKLQPTANFSINPSVFYQHQDIGNANDQLYLSASDIGHGRYVIPDFVPSPADGTTFTQMTLPHSEAGRSDLLVATVNLDWELNGVSVISNSSYVQQKKRQYYDWTHGYDHSYNEEPVVQPGSSTIARFNNLDNAYTQEFRLQSNRDGRLKWTVGTFFQDSEQSTDVLIENNIWALSNNWFGIGDLTNGQPFGPGSTTTENIWGAPTIGASGNGARTDSTSEKQWAAFGQIDFKITDQLTLTAGARYSRDWLRYHLVMSGPENNINAPFGSPCPTGPVCPFNSGGPFAPAWAGGTSKNVEDAFTPRVAINYQLDPNNLFYISASKGYRPGGGQAALPNICNADLKSFGFVDSSGNAVSPLTYKSDSLWSYEVGSKNRLFGGRMTVAGSAYLIKWSGIQTLLTLPTCGFQFIANLASATVKGVDLDLNVMPVNGLTLGASVGYNQMSLDHSLVSPGGGIVLPGGAPVPGSGAPWTVVLSGRYERPWAERRTAYIRGDVTYYSDTPRTSTQIPGVIGYDPLLMPTKANTQVNMRAGVTVGEADISVFVNNLTDAHPLTYGNRSIGDPLWTASTIRPRTVGITAGYHF